VAEVSTMFTLHFSVFIEKTQKSVFTESRIGRVVRAVHQNKEKD
jgi:hypothetical protein